MSVIQRKGSWYYYGEQRLAQGREKTVEVLREDEGLRRWGRVCGWGLFSLSGGHEGLGGAGAPSCKPPQNTHLHALSTSCSLRSKLELQTRQMLDGKDLNDMYDDGSIDETFAEGDDVIRTQLEG